MTPTTPLPTDAELKDLIARLKTTYPSLSKGAFGLLQDAAEALEALVAQRLSPQVGEDVIAAAIEKYNEVWQAAEDIDAHNACAVRRMAMTAALSAARLLSSPREDAESISKGVLVPDENSASGERLEYVSTSPSTDAAKVDAGKMRLVYDKEKRTILAVSQSGKRYALVAQPHCDTELRGALEFYPERIARDLDPESPPSSEEEQLGLQIHAAIQNSPVEVSVHHRNIVLSAVAKAIREHYSALALPASSGQVDEILKYVPDLVKNAMLTQWNEICSDTGCHPDDIKQNFEGVKGHLGFTPKHWASFAGKMVAQNLKDYFDKSLPASIPAPVVDREAVELIITGRVKFNRSTGGFEPESINDAVNHIVSLVSVTNARAGSVQPDLIAGNPCKSDRAAMDQEAVAEKVLEKLRREKFPTEMLRWLTITRWKDGIELDFPSQFFIKIVWEILALLPAGTGDAEAGEKS